MKKYYLIGIVIIAAAVIIFFAKPSVVENGSYYQAKPVQIIEEKAAEPEVQISGPRVIIGSTTIPVEVVRTKAETEKGLSGRVSLSDDQGMLFIFPNSQILSFWMPDMHFNLDIIWINNGKVVDITRNASKQFDPLKPIFYRPKSPARYVVEVNAGYADRHGIKTGEKVSLVDIDL